jgi:hypothetical protein
VAPEGGGGGYHCSFSRQEHSYDSGEDAGAEAAEEVHGDADGLVQHHPHAPAFSLLAEADSFCSADSVGYPLANELEELAHCYESYHPHPHTSSLEDGRDGGKPPLSAALGASSSDRLFEASEAQAFPGARGGLSDRNPVRAASMNSLLHMHNSHNSFKLTAEDPEEEGEDYDFEEPYEISLSISPVRKTQSLKGWVG